MKRKIQITAVIILYTLFAIIVWWVLAPKSFFSIFATQEQVKVVPNTPSSTLTLVGKDQISINGHIWSVEMADNDAERVQGLSGRAKLDKNTGLLFVFDSEDHHPFWMKDMLIPIDMIFLDQDWRIVLVESNLSPVSFPKMFGSTVKSQYVLEINANEAISSNLKVGDRAIFINK